MRELHERRLPHIDQIGVPVFLTWNLAGSLPGSRHFPGGTTTGQAFAAMDRLLDGARAGPLYLRQAALAAMVWEAVQYREQRRELDLHAWVVMANHVHLLTTPHASVSAILHSLKRFTSREGNRFLGLTGQPFWSEESYDHAVRGPEEFRRIARYIEMNPVKAGLVCAPDEFRWSSAWSGHKKH